MTSVYLPERTEGKQKNVVIRPKLPQQSRGRRTQTKVFEVEGNIGASGQNDRSCRRKSMVFVSEQQHKESTCGRGFFIKKRKPFGFRPRTYKIMVSLQKDEFWDIWAWAVCRLPQTRLWLFARGQASLTLKAITTRRLFLAHNDVSLGFQRYLRKELGDVAMTGRFCLGHLDKWCQRKREKSTERVDLQGV